MQLETTRFGTIEVDDVAVITFTQPILGFQEYRRFVLLDGPHGDVGIRWLQSTESSELAFIVMDPRQVVADYAVKPTKLDLTELAASTAEDLDILTLVVVPADRTQVRTNLRAPLLINPKQRLGKQCILDHSEYPVQYFLAKSQEKSDADTTLPGGGKKAKS